MRPTMMPVTMAAMAIAMPAAAAVQTVALGGESFFAAPQTFSFDAGNSITFTTVDKTAFAYNPAGVSTTGSVQIGSFGAPFYPTLQPTSYFTNRGGSFGPGGELPQFVGYASPATVPYSISEGLVGFRFDLGHGYQYGYADLAGSSLYGLRYQTTPGLAVAFGAVPEPATWLLMVAGFGLVGAGVRTRRSVVAA